MGYDKTCGNTKTLSIYTKRDGQFHPFPEKEFLS